MNLELPFMPIAIALRIRDAWRSEKLSPGAAAVLAILGDPATPRLGRKAAIQISEMQRIWSLEGRRPYTDRMVKAAVKELLEVHEVPVGSSRSGCPGYFLIVSDEDLQLAERALQAEFFSIARRLKAINPKSNFGRLLAGQMGIEA